MDQNSNIVNILFLGGAKRVSFARKIIAAGLAKGLKVNIFSFELYLDAPIAAVGTVIPGNKWGDPRILENLHDTVVKNGINIILPFVDPAIGIASRYAQEYGDVWTPVVSPELAEQLFDKKEAAALYGRLGLPIPVTYTGGRPHFPLIGKPRHGSASKGLIIVDSVSDFRRVLKMDEYMMQAYIPKRKEYTVDAYVTMAGDVVCVSPRVRLEVLGGEVTRTVTVDDPDLTALATECIVRLGLRGIVTLQFIKDLTTDEIMLMEVNPRPGGGIVCSCHAGADIPSLMFDDYLGKEIRPIQDIKPGVLICRYFDETVFNV